MVTLKGVSSFQISNPITCKYKASVVHGSFKVVKIFRKSLELVTLENLKIF